MATLDDKLLGEKLHYYCSSSEDEVENDDEINEPQPINQNHSVPVEKWEGKSCNTGPKGVVKDYMRFKQLEREQNEAEKEELELLTKKFSMTCRTNAEDDKAREEEAKLEAELEELFGDPDIQRFVQKRMNEMLSQEASRRRFGSVYPLAGCDQFLAAIDEEDKNVCIIVLLYEPNASGCSHAVKAVEFLAREYTHYKFCMVRPSFISMSTNFKVGGVPAILVYKGGQVTGNFVKLTVDLGCSFDSGDLENYLIENGILNDKNLVPELADGNPIREKDSSDDE